MTTLFIDGFDKYGPPGLVIPNQQSLITQGEWTSAIGSTPISILPGLSETGYALGLLEGSLNKTLTSNKTRLIGGVRINTTDLSAGTSLDANCGVQFSDTSTVQCNLGVEAVTGLITIWKGDQSTILARSSALVTSGTTHYLEWDITFGVGAAGSYTIYLDGVQVLTGTGTTQQSTNAYANIFSLFANPATPLSFDDLYLFDSTTSINNQVLLSNPRIQTDYPAFDFQTQFLNEGNIIGEPYAINLFQAINSDTLILYPYTPSVNCTINSINVMTENTSGSNQIRGVLYADSSGHPGSLLTSGTTENSVTNGVVRTLPLTTPHALTAGTQYWLGFMGRGADGLTYYCSDINNLAYSAAATFSSGAPGTAPTMTAGYPSVLVFGICIGATTNWETLSQNPALTTSANYTTPPPNYIQHSTVGTEDLYNFPIPATDVVKIYTVAMKACARLSSAGSRSIALDVKSGSTDGNGSLGSAALSTSFVWYGSYFDTDPATSVAWTISGVTNAHYGQKISA